METIKLREDYIKPVSYTHLDVYKRQVLNLTELDHNRPLQMDDILKFVCRLTMYP